MRKRRFLALVILAFVIVLGALASLNYSGYCVRDARFLTQAELVDAGVRDYFASYPPPVYSNFVRVTAPIPYSSVEDFVSRNPNCCELNPTGRQGETPGLFSRILGRFAGYVRIDYMLEEATNNVPHTNLVRVAVSNCGRVWNGISWGG